MGRHGGGHGTCGSRRAPRGRPPPPERRLEKGAREPCAEGSLLQEGGWRRPPQSPRWVLAAASTGELSLNFWSTLCELEPWARAARGGSVGSLMAGAPHNRPGGGLRALAGLNRGRSSSWEGKRPVGGRRPRGPGPGGQGRSALDPWGLMAAPAAWTRGACLRLDSGGLPASGCGFPKVRELICLLVCGTCTSARMRLSLVGLKAG